MPQADTNSCHAADTPVDNPDIHGARDTSHILRDDGATEPARHIDARLEQRSPALSSHRLKRLKSTRAQRPIRWSKASLLQCA
jgi:hypothetical protein